LKSGTSKKLYPGRLALFKYHAMPSAGVGGCFYEAARYLKHNLGAGLTLMY